MESLRAEMESKRIFSAKKEMIVQDGFDCLVLFCEQKICLLTAKG